MKKLLGLVCLVLTTCTHARVANLAIRGVTVVDVTDGRLHPARTVLVNGDRIVAIGPSDRVAIPADAEVMDGTDGYLIPGLWDMHVHGTRRESTYPLYLANGVTGVRDMFGPPDAAAFRRALAAKQIASPRIYLAGPILDGSPPIWPSSVVVTTAEEARRAVSEQKAHGADFIKVYQRLPRDAYYAILAESARHGLPVAGHVPSSISPWEAVAAGQTTIEHLTQVPTACSSEETSLREVPVRSYAGAIRVMVEASQTFDPAKCSLLYEAMKRNGTWAVPTFVAKRGDGWANDPAFVADARLRYFGPELRRFLAPGAADAVPDGLNDDDRRVARELFAFDQKVVGEMFRAGVGILAGTDAINPYAFPGFSLHDELALLVDAGMTPLAALQAATSSAATFMRRSADLGSVTAGKLADLVLLDANPLQDIRNTQKIRAVVADGRLFRRADLDRLLTEAAATASSHDEEQK